MWNETGIETINLIETYPTKVPKVPSMDYSAFGLLKTSSL